MALLDTLDNHHMTMYGVAAVLVLVIYLVNSIVLLASADIDVDVWNWFSLIMWILAALLVAGSVFVHLMKRNDGSRYHNIALALAFMFFAVSFVLTQCTVMFNDGTKSEGVKVADVIVLSLSAVCGVGAAVLSARRA